MVAATPPVVQLKQRGCGVAQNGAGARPVCVGIISAFLRFIMQSVVPADRFLAHETLKGLLFFEDFGCFNQISGFLRYKVSLYSQPIGRGINK